MAKTLIVLAPAMSGRTARWRPLKKRLAAEPRLADSQWLDFDPRSLAVDAAHAPGSRQRPASED
jgi:hypothetical protein